MPDKDGFVSVGGRMRFVDKTKDVQRVYEWSPEFVLTEEENERFTCRMCYRMKVWIEIRFYFHAFRKIDLKGEYPVKQKNH